MKYLLSLLLLSASLLNAEALSKKTYDNVTVSEVTSVYDGDTFRANIKEFPELIGYRIAIRIKGVDTPEIRGKCLHEKALARKAKEFTVTALRGAKKIELHNIKRGKYFRIVADVYVDGINLTDSLIDAKLGVAYDGGKKQKDWCE